MYKLPEDIDSKYRFVTLASKRAEQLQMGALPKADSEARRKATLIAQEEVATGLVGPYDPEIEVAAESEELLEEE